MPLLNCVKEELNLANVLLSGQSFRWVKVLESDDAYNSIHDTFIGVAQHRVWKLRRENDKQVYYEVLGKFSEAIGDDHDTLRNYFQLDVDLNHLYKYWSENDEHFAELMKSYRNDLEGIRILCQDPLETVFAFICSSNNHIKRITNMVEILCELYGESITVPYYGKLKKFYDFADPRLMADDRMLEITLRNHGFGYRAPSIAYAAKALRNGGKELMENLSSKSYERASEELLRFRGIGRKVADCICLMGLHMHSVVPVDTHILQITIENYLPNLTVEKYSQKYRKKITTVWQKKFGPFAGWAQAVLFTAHLRRMGVRPLPKKKSNKGKKE